MRCQIPSSFLGVSFILPAERSGRSLNLFADRVKGFIGQIVLDLASVFSGNIFRNTDLNQIPCQCLMPVVDLPGDRI